MRQESRTGVYVAVHPFEVVSGDIEQWLSSLGSVIGENTAMVITSSNSVLGMSHLRSALHHGIRAVRTDTARARDRSIEMLRWISGRRQVSEALKATSVSGSGSHLLAILIPNQLFRNGQNHGEIDLSLEEWKGPSVQGLEPLNVSVAFSMKGSDIGEDLSHEDREKAVLERVAMTDI